MHRRDNPILIFFFTLLLLISMFSSTSAQDNNPASASVTASEYGDICASGEAVEFETTFWGTEKDNWHLYPGNATVGGEWAAQSGVTIWIQAIGYIPHPTRTENVGILIMGKSNNEGFPEPNYLATSGTSSTLTYTFSEGQPFWIYVLSDPERDSGVPLTVRVGCGEPDFIATVSPSTPAPDVTVQATTQAPRSGLTKNSDWTPVIQEFDGVDMVLVPAGCFTLDRPAQTVPEYDVCIDQQFWMDRTEVSYEQLQPYLPQMVDVLYPDWQVNAPQNMSSEQLAQLLLSQLEPFIKDSRTPGIPNLPPKSINWDQAKAFCELRGGRLPTTIEWEYAARGPEKFLYPWGNEADDTRWASFGVTRGTIMPVDSFPEGASWVGALNMMGNVSEYTSTLYDAFAFTYPYKATDGREDLSVQGNRILRGTSASDDNGTLREETSLFQAENILNIDDRVGIRCVRDFEGTEIIPQSATDDNTAAGGVADLEAVEINSSDQRHLSVYIPAGWSQEIVRANGKNSVTSQPERGQFDFHPPLGAYQVGTSPELRYRVVPYTRYEGICIALSSLNRDYRLGARYSFSGSVCDTFEGEPTTQTFAGTEWLLLKYDAIGSISEESTEPKVYTLAVTVGKGYLIEVDLISLAKNHDEQLQSLLYPVLTAFSFDTIEGQGVVGLPPTPVPYGAACSPNGKPTRLFVGVHGKPVSVIRKPMYASPTASSKISDRIAWLDGTFLVLEGPLCVENTAFFRIDYNGVQGWIREASSVPGSPADYDVDRTEDVASDGSVVIQPTASQNTEQGSAATATPSITATPAAESSTAIPTPVPTPIHCPNNLVSRLTVGAPGRVTPGDSNNLRSTPSKSGQLLGKIPGSGRFEVIGAQTCADGLTWVQVDYNGLIGWTVEAVSDEYWLEPIP